MKYVEIAVSQINTADTTFRYYREGDPFDERTSLPSELASAQVILRELAGAQQYQIIYGHLIVDALAPEDKVQAIVYGRKELSDDGCREFILKHDAATHAQLLTQYERAQLIRDMGKSMYRAAEILNVSKTVVRKWIRGAKVYDEVAAVGAKLAGLSFSHLIALAELAGKASKNGVTATAEDKKGYLEECAKREFSVSQFTAWLEKKLGLVEEEPAPAVDCQEDSDDLDSEVESPLPATDAADEEDDSVDLPGEIQGQIDQVLLDLGLLDDFRLRIDCEGHVTLTVGPVAVSALGDVAKAIRKAKAILASHLHPNT
jgi:hypothetical protein